MLHILHQRTAVSISLAILLQKVPDRRRMSLTTIPARCGVDTWLVGRYIWMACKRVAGWDERDALFWDLKMGWWMWDTSRYIQNWPLLTCEHANRSGWDHLKTLPKARLTWELNPCSRSDKKVCVLSFIAWCRWYATHNKSDGPYS